jgi:hypothetical protein
MTKDGGSQDLARELQLLKGKKAQFMIGPSGSVE